MSSRHFGTASRIRNWSHSIDDHSLENQAARHKSTATRRHGLKRDIVEVTLPELQLQLKKAAYYLGDLLFGGHCIAPA